MKLFIIVSHNPLYFHVITFNVFFFISDFIYLTLLFFLSEAKILSALFIFLKNQLLFCWSFQLFFWSPFHLLLIWSFFFFLLLLLILSLVCSSFSSSLRYKVKSFIWVLYSFLIHVFTDIIFLSKLLLQHPIGFCMRRLHFYLFQGVSWFPFCFLSPIVCSGVCCLILLIFSSVPLWLEKILFWFQSSWIC